MLEVARGDHDPIDVFQGEHLFGILEALGSEAKGLLDLCGPSLASLAPQIADCDYFDRHLPRGQRHHVHMSLASIAASELRETYAIVGSDDARIRFGGQAGCQRRVSCLFCESAAIDFALICLRHRVLLVSLRLRY